MKNVCLNKGHFFLDGNISYKKEVNSIVPAPSAYTYLEDS